MFQKYSWKPVEIDRSLLSGGIEDLIGIEECSDYEINDLVLSKKVKLGLVYFMYCLPILNWCSSISCSSLLLLYEFEK